MKNWFFVPPSPGRPMFRQQMPKVSSNRYARQPVNNSPAGAAARMVEQLMGAFNARDQKQDQAQLDQAIAGGGSAKPWEPPAGETFYAGPSNGGGPLSARLQDDDLGYVQGFDPDDKTVPRETFMANQAPAGGLAGMLAAVQQLGPDNQFAGPWARQLTMAMAEGRQQREAEKRKLKSAITLKQTPGAPKAKVPGKDIAYTPDVMAQLERLKKAGRGSGITPAQQANNAEKLAERERMVSGFEASAKPGQTPADFYSSPLGYDSMSLSPRNPVVAKDFNSARQRMVGDDPGYSEFHTWWNTPKAAPPAAPEGSDSPTASGAAVPRSPTSLTDALTEAYPRSSLAPSSAARARKTVNRIGPTPADMANMAPTSPLADFLGAMPKFGGAPGGPGTSTPRAPGSRADDLERMGVGPRMAGLFNPHDPNAIPAPPGPGTSVDGLPPLPASATPPAPRPKPSRAAQGRGRGTQAEPFRVENEAEFNVIKSGEYYLNPSDGVVYRKK